MVIQERIIGKNMHVDNVRKDYVIRTINEEQLKQIEDYFAGKIARTAECPLIGLAWGQIKVYGYTTHPALTEKLIKPFIEPEMLTFRWHNIRDIFTAGRVKENPEGERFLTQSRRDALFIFNEHCKKLENPKIIIIYAKGTDSPLHNTVKYDTANGTREAY